MVYLRTLQFVDGDGERKYNKKCTSITVIKAVLCRKNYIFFTSGQNSLHGRQNFQNISSDLNFVCEHSERNFLKRL